MNRQSFGQAYGGRASPFYSFSPARTDRSFSDLYSYVDEDHNPLNVVGHTRPSVAIYDDDDDSPDIIHIRFRAENFALEFPPFSIAEERVCVRDVRAKVSRALDVDYGRIRLVYKDRDLRRDDMPLRNYGCKQNSEIAVVITQEIIDYSGHASHSGSDNDSSASSLRHEQQEQSRPRSNSTYRRRGDEPRPTPVSNGFLHPVHAQSTSTVRPQRSSSPARQSIPQPTAQPTAPPVQPPKSVQLPTADPSTPMGKVQIMRHEWQSKWLPEVERFLRSPPADKDERTKDYRKLKESVYKRVFEVGDSIDSEGSAEVRSVRKACFAEAESYLEKLDKYKPESK